MPPAGKKRKKSSSPFVASGLAEVMAAETNQGAPSRSRIVVRCGGLVDIGKQKVRWDAAKMALSCETDESLARRLLDIYFLWLDPGVSLENVLEDASTRSQDVPPLKIELQDDFRIAEETDRQIFENDGRNILKEAIFEEKYDPNVDQNDGRPRRDGQESVIHGNEKEKRSPYSQAQALELKNSKNKHHQRESCRSNDDGRDSIEFEEGSRRREKLEENVSNRNDRLEDVGRTDHPHAAKDTSQHGERSDFSENDDNRGDEENFKDTDDELEQEQHPPTKKHGVLHLQQQRELTEQTLEVKEDSRWPATEILEALKSKRSGSAGPFTTLHSIHQTAEKTNFFNDTIPFACKAPCETAPPTALVSALPPNRLTVLPSTSAVQDTPSTVSAVEGPSLQDFEYQPINIYPPRFPCPQCSMVFSEAHQLSSHSRETHTFPCTEMGCSLIFKRKATLNRHIQETHSDNVFPCPEKGCPLSFKQRSTLNQHVRLHSNFKPYQCRWCEFAGFQQNNVRSHALSKHRDQFMLAKESKERYWQPTQTLK